MLIINYNGISNLFYYSNTLIHTFLFQFIIKTHGG